MTGNETILQRVALCWPILLLVGFASPFIPFASVLGYRWSVELCFAGFLLVAAIFALQSGARLGVSGNEFRFVILPLILFIAWSFASIFWSDSWRGALHHSLLWSCYLGFYFLIRLTADNETRGAMLKILGAIVFAVSFACIIEYFGRDEAAVKTFNERYYSFAESVAALIPLFIAVVLSAGTKWSRLALLVSALATAVVISTTSRTMLIALISGITVFVILGLFIHRRFEHPKRIAFALLTLVAVILLVQIPFRSRDYTSTITRLAERDESSAASTQSRVLMWGLAVEGFRSSPLVGIGADNYFTDYKELRERFSERDPSNAVLEVNEEFIPERAHNEFLQILAELGIIGAALFVWLMIGIGYMFYIAFKKRASLKTIGALSGIAAFLLASSASSYSFRFPANGICFLFLLALAARELFGEVETAIPAKAQWLGKLIPIFGIVVSIAMIDFCIVRANSIRHLTNAMNATDLKLRNAEIEMAIEIDPTEPIFRFYKGQWLSMDGNPDHAIPELRFAIDNGLANSSTYFRLIAAEKNAGRQNDAQLEFAEALRVYPRSVFLRTAYASYLKRRGDQISADAEYQAALRINEKQTRSWQLAHDEGLERLVQVSRTNSNYLSPFDLLPTDAPLALSAERVSQQ